MDQNQYNQNPNQFQNNSFQPNVQPSQTNNNAHFGGNQNMNYQEQIRQQQMRAQQQGNGQYYQPNYNQQQVPQYQQPQQQYNNQTQQVSVEIPKKKTKKFKKRYAVAAVFLLLDIVAVGGGSGSSEIESSKASSEIPDVTAALESVTSEIEESIEKESSQLKQSYNVGEAAEVNDFTFVVNEVVPNHQTGNEFLSAEEGNKFVKANVTITNNGDDREVVSSLIDFYLKDSEGTKYDIAIFGYGNSDTQVDGELLSGDKIKGDLIYEVPNDATGLRVYYNPSFLFGESIIVDLGI